MPLLNTNLSKTCLFSLCKSLHVNMISSAGQVSPHVPVCFGTWAAPFTSLNSCKFGAKSCPLLHESARQPSPLLHHGSLRLQPGWVPAPHSWVPGWGGPTRALIFHKLACERGTGSLTACSFLCFSNNFWSCWFSRDFPLLKSPAPGIFWFCDYSSFQEK